MSERGQAMDASFRASVVSHRQVESGKVVFKIVVVSLNLGSGDAAVQWELEKRFSDFQKLHQNIKRVSVGKLIPKIPPKKMFGARKTTFLLRRQTLLDEYIRSLLHCNATKLPEVAGMLQSFLETAEHADRGAQGEALPANDAVPRRRSSGTDNDSELGHMNVLYETFSLCPFCIVGRERKQRTWLAAQVKCMDGGDTVSVAEAIQSTKRFRSPNRGAAKQRGPRVWLCAKCQIHGDIRTLYCSSIPFFQKLSRYNTFTAASMRNAGAPRCPHTPAGAQQQQMASPFKSKQEYDKVEAYARQSEQHSKEMVQ